MRRWKAVDLWQGVHWHSRRLSGRLRARIGGGTFTWQVLDGVRFVHTVDDRFSELLYHHRGHEMVELEWCTRWLAEDGREVIDCGANIGWFSAVLCQRLPALRSIAVEGNPNTADRCRRVLGRLGLADRVEIINSILADGRSERFVVPDLPGREPWQRARHAHDSEGGVAGSTLDQLVEDHKAEPDLIKIDCEGFETRILRGAKALLERRAAVWVVECNQQALRNAGSDRKELLQIFEAAAYSCYHLASFDRRLPLGIPVNDDFPSASFNFAAIPARGPLAAKWATSIREFRA